MISMRSANGKIDNNSELVKGWYNLAIENATDMIFIHDNEGKITYINETGIKESGYSEEELIKMNPLQLVPPEYYNKLGELQVRRLNGDMGVFLYEAEFIKKSGERVDVRVSSSPILKNGNLEGFIHTMRNISDVKKAEKLIISQLELNSKLAQTKDMKLALDVVLDTAFGIGDVDCGGVYIFEEDVNKYILKVHRNLSKEYADAVYSIDKDSIHAKIIEKGEPIFANYKEYPEDLGGVIHNLLINKEKIKAIALIPFFYQNKAIGTLSLGSHSKESISEVSKNILILLSQKIGGAISRIMAEDTLRKNEIKYREIVESANSVIFVFDIKGKILSMNEYGISFFGYEKGELVGKNVYETITPEIESTGRNLKNLVNDIHTNLKEFGIHINENIRKNGEKVWVYWSNKPIYDDKGNLTAILAIGNDITEKRHLEEKIKYSEIKFKALFENAHESILILNNDFLIEDINRATVKALGYTKGKLLDNMNIFDLSSPLETERLKHILFREFTGESISFETYFINGNGKVFPVEVSFSRIEVKGEKAIICILRDITEHRKKEDDLKKQLLKYDLDEGNVYLSNEPSNTVPFEAFKELVGIGYRGIIISREEKEHFNYERQNSDYYWISKKGGPKTVSTNLVKLKEFVSSFNNKSVLLLDSIDFLIANNGFNEVYNFISELREIAYFGKNIIILSLDKSAFDQKQLKLLEKETKQILQKTSDTVDRKINDIIYYLLNQNKLGVNPSFSSIGKELVMTRPTVRKNIKYLESKKYVIVHRNGRNKKVELTEKGKKLL